MPELGVIASGVLAANANTAKAYGVSGTAIAAGQAVYADPSSTPTGLIRPAIATAASGGTPALNVVGLALNSTAGSLEAVAYATAGDVILPTSAGGGASAMVSGSVYVVSAGTAGNLVSAIDPMAANNYVTVVGMAVGTSIFRVSPNPVAAVHG